MAKAREAPIRRSGFSPENIAPEIKSGIGELITQWSYVSFQLGVVVRVAFRLDHDAGFALLFGTELQPLCRTLRTLAQNDKWVPDAALREEIKQLAKDVQDKKDRRHDFAHGVFGLAKTKDGRVVFVRFRFGDVRQQRATVPTEIVTTELLQDLADEAYDLGRRAQNITVRLKALRAAK